MSRAPLVMPKPEVGFVRGHQTLYDSMLGWRMINPRMTELHDTLGMGDTAERVAERHGTERIVDVVARRATEGDGDVVDPEDFFEGARARAHQAAIRTSGNRISDCRGQG